MNHGRLAHWLCAGAVALAFAPPSIAQEQASAELAPNEIRTALQASRAVFAAQAAERREAESAGLTDLADELRSLHRVILDAAGSQAAARLRRAPTEGGLPGPSAAADERFANVQTQLDGCQARTRSIEARIGRLKSPRQRELARTATARLHALRAEAEAALAASEQDREALLTALADRLTVKRADPENREGPQLPPPTFVVAPERVVINTGKRWQSKGE